MSKKYEFPYFEYKVNFEEFIRNNKLEKTDKIMYDSLLSFARTKRAKFFANDHALNALCGFSKNTFTACRKRLREHGLIKYKSGNSKIMATEYELIPNVKESLLQKALAEMEAQNEMESNLINTTTVPMAGDNLGNELGNKLGNELGSHIKDNNNIKSPPNPSPNGERRVRSRNRPFEKDSRSVGDNADSLKLKRISGNQQGIPVMYLFSAVHFAKVHVGMTFLHDMKRFEKVGSTNAQELETSLNRTFSNETEVWVYHSTEPVEAPSSTEGENGGN